MKSLLNLIKPDKTRRERSSPRSNERGFALMEAVMAAAMMGIVVVGTLQFFSFGQARMSNLAIDRSAYDIARSEIEKNLARDYDNVVAAYDTTQFLFGDRVYITTTVDPVDDATDLLGILDTNGSDDYKKVTVEVSYMEQTKTAKLTTLITSTDE